MNSDFSARKLMVSIFSITFCIIMVMVGLALMAGKVTLDAFLGVFTPFVLVVREISDKYFGRTDREKKESK